MKNAAIVSIDAAGCLVVPEEIRREAGMQPGMQLRMSYQDGRIEIEPVPRSVRVVKKGRFAVAIPEDPSETLTAGAVRRTQKALRTRSED